MTFVSNSNIHYETDTDCEDDKSIKELTKRANDLHKEMENKYTKRDILIFLGLNLSSVFIFYNFWNIIRFIYLIILFTSGIGISTIIITQYIRITKNNLDENEEFDIETEYDIYINFLNKDYERFSECMENKEYLIKDKNKILELKNKERHLNLTLPFKPNNKIIIYYDYDDNKFHYYTKGDLNYKVLNSICRTYVLENKCINLFVDEEEVEYIKNNILNKQIETNRTDDEDDENNSYEVLSNTDKEEEKEVKEKEVKEKEVKEDKEESIFYKSKKNIKKEKEKENNKDKIKNKFIHVGSIQDYENEVNKTNKLNKNINYSKYKELFKFN
jgi:hypothetical protein